MSSNLIEFANALLTRNAPAVQTRMRDLAALDPETLRLMLDPLPIVVGENVNTYFRYFTMVADEEKPVTWHQWRAVKQIVDAEWDLLRFSKINVWIFNVAIAEAVQWQLADDEADDELIERQRSGISVAKMSVEALLGDGRLRSLRKTAFAAVSGDSAAIKFVEDRLGPGKIDMSVMSVSAFERAMASRARVDRAVSFALDRRKQGYDQLERLAVKQSQLQAPDTSDTSLESLAASTLSLSDLCRLVMTQKRTTAPRGEAQVPLLHSSSSDSAAVPEEEVSASVHGPSVDHPEQAAETPVSVHAPNIAPSEPQSDPEDPLRNPR